jgi:hypothetical protein
MALIGKSPWPDPYCIPSTSQHSSIRPRWCMQYIPLKCWHGQHTIWHKYLLCLL